MAVATKKRERIPINREVLQWARERIRLSYEDAAEVAHFKPEQIREWEEGPNVPTVKQARKLADVYDRPFLEFFAKEKPTLRPPELVPDFRMHRGEDPKEHYELVLIQTEAEEVRLNALDLFELVDEEPPSLPEAIYAKDGERAHEAAERARQTIGPLLEAQIGLKKSKRDDFVKTLRSTLEAAGILVTKNTALAAYSSRGMCIYDPVLPIVVYSNESPGAQAFTLAHELGHISMKQSAISGPPGSSRGAAKIHEDWCDAFAGAFLVPAHALESLMRKPHRPLSEIDDSDLTELAGRFAISRHAMMVRLVNLGYVNPAYYWEVKRPQFLAEERTYKSRGRAKYYGSRYRTYRGDLYTGLVLDAWSNGAITNHNAAEFMGIDNITHLEAIRDNFGG